MSKFIVESPQDVDLHGAHAQSYRETNRAGWAFLSRNGCESSQPYGAEQFSDAKAWLDPEDWLPWKQIRSVLCLACGGGQQGPLFASLGCQVTVYDLSPEQLDLDRKTAREHNFDIECIEGDMTDLSELHGRNFDLVYQSISACYIPDVRVLYDEVHRVLRPGAYYRAEHWNPVQLQLPQYGSWDGGAYRIVLPQTAGQPVQWREWDEDGVEKPTCRHYIHPLTELIGQLCEAGFAIMRFSESRSGDLSATPGEHTHVACYLPPFFAMLSRRHQQPRPRRTE